jgi:two-component system, NtrC family, nitrogen regulation sensor histidine kinase NtrY
MHGGQRVIASIAGSVRRFRISGIVFVILGLLGLSYVIELAVLSYQGKTWDQRIEARSAEYLKKATQRFTGLQRSTRRLAVEIAAHSTVLDYLGGTLRDSIELFSYVSRISRDEDVGIEVFDRTGRLCAWEGRSDAGHAREVQIALDGQLTSYVNSGPVFSFLFIATPVRYGGRVVGAVLVRQTIGVNYPLSNRFINREGLSVQLSQESGLPVTFTFDRDAPLRRDGRYISASLFGIDSSRVGVVSILRPLRSAYLEGIAQQFRRVHAVLVAALILLLVIVGIRWGMRRQSLLMQSLVVTAVIWGARYALLWMDISGTLASGGIFDPASFASKFGGGAAKSIGEMTLTTLALLINAGLVLWAVLVRIRLGFPWWHPSAVAVRLPIAVVAATLIFLLLRGYGAAVRSAVFDSTLSFTDPGVIIPSFPLGVMVVNLFILSFCLILAAAGLTSFLVSLLRRGNRERPSTRGAWLAACGLFVVAAVLFDVLQPNPLMSTPYRLLFGAGMIAFTRRLHVHAEQRLRLPTFRNLLLALGLSTLFFYPLLDAYVREKDHERLEAMAVEVLRPVDGWLTFVVEDALGRLADGETADVLMEGTREQVDKLAFTRWAGSVASREGYTCRVQIADSAGEILSRFTLGNQSLFDRNISMPPHLPGEKRIFIREVGSGISAVRLYAGSIPILAPGLPPTWGVFILAAGQQTFFRGENPAILRSVSDEDRESFHHDVILAEYREGLLLTSTDPRLPLTHRLPDEVAVALGDSTAGPVWASQDIDGSAFDVLFTRRPGDPGQVLAIAMGSGGFQWHLLNVVKMMIYYTLIVSLLFVALFFVRWIRGYRYVPTFRDKLLGALLFTSIVPVVVLAIYGRSLARERVLESTARLLEQETGAVAAGLLQRDELNAAAPASPGVPVVAAGLAADLGTDFNLYAGTRLVASSRPELFATGILDKRMSGSAYAGIYIQGKRFYLQTERIGLYQYAVGYAPLLEDGNRVVGVVSVPTLYHQEEIDRDASQRSALLLGLYGVVFLGIVGIATTFANRMAAPIHFLTEATKRVSRGELDIAMRVPEAEGEVGELIRSFETMTRDLKRSREDLVQFEREMAWKEMARQVAHEIKNPLTPMKLSLQHLQQTYRDRAPDFSRIFNEVSRTMIDQIDALSRIASEFSRFGRMPDPVRERCDVNAVLQESVDLFERDTNVVFTTAAAPGLPPVTADREELRRAFINIIRNAMQAMNNRGKISLSTADAGPEVIVRIQDSGPGMSEEVKARLFQPNFSTKTDGMGLGLAIVKKTLGDLGGSIRVESSEGGGTTVIMHLPAAVEGEKA